MEISRCSDESTHFPKVCVAMSVCAGVRFDWLETSVQSILNQSYSRFDFYIYIDGPLEPENDSYLQTLEVKDSRVTIFSDPVRRGLSSRMFDATTRCVSNGYDFVFRMDADDIALPDRMSKQLAFMLLRSDVDVLGTGLIEISETGEEVGKRIPPENHNLLHRVLSRRCPLNHPTVCIRVLALETKGNYNPKHLNTQDYFLWIEMAKNGATFANLREPLLKFRRVDGFYKRRGKDKSWNELKARFTAMKELKQWSFFNVCYALLVFCLRMMPPSIIKFAYKMDRKYFHKRA